MSRNPAREKGRKTVPGVAVNEVQIVYDDGFKIDLQSGIGLEIGDMLILFPGRFYAYTSITDSVRVKRFVVSSDNVLQLVQDIRDIRAAVDDDLDWEPLNDMQGRDFIPVVEYLEANNIEI